MTDHYATLGVGKEADSAAIRRAFGRLAKELHPDKNPSPQAAERFMAVKEAYDVLSDPERRRAHDAVLRLNDEIARKKQEDEREAIRARNEASQRRQEDEKKAAWVANRERVDRLVKLMNSGRLADAEALAGEILTVDPRNAVAFAAKGDIARVRGALMDAQKFYAYAVQFDSTNPVYQRKWEEVMEGAKEGDTVKVRDASDIGVGPGLTMTFVVLSGAAYTVLAKEAPLLAGSGLAGTLTLGLVVMLLVSGVTVGACLTAANALDPIDASLGSAVVKVPPAVTLGFVAILNYWLAVGLYVLLGATQGAFNRSLSRLLGFSGLVVLVFSLARLTAGPTGLWQTLLWGGNFVYLGAACGWFMAESLRRV